MSRTVCVVNMPPLRQSHAFGSPEQKMRRFMRKPCVTYDCTMPARIVARLRMGRVRRGKGSRAVPTADAAP